MPVLGYQGCPCQRAAETWHKPWLAQGPLLGSGSGSSHTLVLQSIVVKLKLLMIIMSCKHFICSQYLPPEHTPVPRSSFFHLSVEMKTAPGCMDTMQALGHDSRTLFLFSQGRGSVCVSEAVVHAAMTCLCHSTGLPRARAMLGTWSDEPQHSLGTKNWEEVWER